MSEIRKHSGVYVVSSSKGIECYESLPQEHQYNLERLRHQTIFHEKQIPRSFWLGTSHGDEGESSQVQEEINALYPFSRVEAWVGHELANRTNSRKYAVPLNSHEDGILGDSVVMKNGLAGKEVDLNRQYAPPPEPPGDWSEALSNIAYGPAKLPLQLVRDNPSLEVFLSIHEDLSNGHKRNPLGLLFPRFRNRDSLYLYDVRERKHDPDDPVVDRQMDVLRSIMRSRGIKLFDGVDDPKDPVLGNRVRNGLIRQSAYDENGALALDNTLEMYLLYLNSIGLGHIRRAFVVEVPGKLKREQKKELLTILSDVFFFPVLEQLDLL